MVISRAASILLLAPSVFLLGYTGVSHAPVSDWPGYEGGQTSRHFSPLRQIDRTNIQELDLAWTYPTGETDSGAEPLVLGDKLLVVAGDEAVAALDPGTGAELWRTETGLRLQQMRGFAYWRNLDGSEQRVIIAAGTRMRALDPDTGKFVEGFDVDLRIDLGVDPSRIARIASPTPGRVFENLIIVGSVTGEDYGSPPGHVRAYDVRDGRLVWTFHTIPQPGEAGVETWPHGASNTAGGANVWGGLSVDDDRAIAYFVTGSPTYDFYGADRQGDNLYGNSIVAVDARSGQRLWHFQTVHHDLWDYDLTASPVLLDVRHRGRLVPAVAVAGKTGFLYVFDRVNGRPLWPIPERAVPTSDVPGEHASATQPIPDWPLPFARQRFDADDLDPALSREERAEMTARISATRNNGIFTPPSLAGSVQMPGSHGGANWGMSGADPITGRYYVISGDLPAVLKLTETLSTDSLQLIARARGRGAAVYAANCQLCHGAKRDGQPPAVPDLQTVTDRMSRGEIEAIIREGRAQMPGFPDLDGNDVQGLLAYLGGKSAPAIATGSPPVRLERTVTEMPHYRSSFGYLLSQAGESVIAPPWQTLTAYDLNSGNRLWQVPVGTAAGRNEPTGTTVSKAGLLITAGGLVFAATEADRKLHAYDAKTGQELWSGALPAKPRGGLVTYRYRGRQFVVVPASNAGGLTFSELPSTFSAGRNSYAAFALPAKAR